MLIDLETLSPQQVYFTMTQTLIPRPVAWVLSDNGDGGYNLAPFSYFNAVCSEPPLVMVSIGKKPAGAAKDTLANIAARAAFTVHIAGLDLLPALNQTAMTLPHGESELDHVELELADMPGCPLPRIAGCPVAYACRRHHIQAIGNSGQSLIFGRVNAIYLRDDIAATDSKGRLKVSAARLDPVARLGAGEYAQLGEVIALPRPR